TILGSVLGAASDAPFTSAPASPAAPLFFVPVASLFETVIAEVYEWWMGGEPNEPRRPSVIIATWRLTARMQLSRRRFWVLKVLVRDHAMAAVRRRVTGRAAGPSC